VKEEEGTEELSWQKRCISSPKKFQGHSKTTIASTCFSTAIPLPTADHIIIYAGKDL